MVEPIELQQQINSSISLLAEAENRFQRCQALQQLSELIDVWLQYCKSPKNCSNIFENDFRINLQTLSQYIASTILHLSDPLANFAEHCKLQAQLAEIILEDSKQNSAPSLEIQTLLYLWRNAYCISGSLDSDGAKIKSVNSEFVNWTRLLLPCSGKWALQLIFILLEILQHCDRQEIVACVLESLSKVPQGVEPSSVYPGIVSRIVGHLSQFSRVSFPIAIETLSQLLLYCKDDEALVTKSVEWVEYIFKKYGNRPNRHLLPLFRAAIEIETMHRNLEGILSEYVLTREPSDVAPLLAKANLTRLKLAIKALVTREMQQPSDASLQLFRGYLKLQECMQNVQVDFYLALAFFLKFDIVIKEDYHGGLDGASFWTKMDTSNIHLEHKLILNPEIKGVVLGNKRWFIRQRKSQEVIPSTLRLTVNSISKLDSNKVKRLTSNDLNICVNSCPPKYPQKPLISSQPLIQVISESANANDDNDDNVAATKDDSSEIEAYTYADEYTVLLQILKSGQLPTHFTLWPNTHQEQYNSTMSLYIEVARDYFKSLSDVQQLDILNNVISCIKVENTEARAMALASKLLHLTTIFASATDSLEKFINVISNLLEYLTCKKVLDILAFSHGHNGALVNLCKARLCTCISQILYTGCLQGLNLLSRRQIGALLYFCLPECSLGSKLVSVSCVELVKVLTLVHVTFSPAAKPMLQVYYNYLVNAAISTLSNVRLLYGPTRVCQLLTILSSGDFTDTKSIFDLVVAISNNSYSKAIDAYNASLTTYDIGVMLYSFNVLLVALERCESWAPKSKFEDEIIDSNLAICSLICTRSRYFVDGTRNGYFALVAIYRCFEAFATKPRVAGVRMAEVWPCLEFFFKNNGLECSRHLMVATRILNVGISSSFHIIDFRLDQLMPRIIKLVQDSNISAAHQCNTSSSFKATVSLLLMVKRISESTSNFDTLGQCLAVALSACKYESLVNWAILILEPLFAKNPSLIARVLSIFQKRDFSRADVALLNFAVKTPTFKSTINLHTPTLL